MFILGSLKRVPHICPVCYLVWLGGGGGVVLVSSFTSVIWGSVSVVGLESSPEFTTSFPGIALHT